VFTSKYNDAGTSNLNWTYTYEFSYDLRGNIRSSNCTITGSANPPARPVDLPDTLKYDSHNRLVEYEVTRDIGDNVKLFYDPVGRVFRKEVYTDHVLDSATHYFYNGGNLIQEFDEMVDDSVLKDDIIWDYLRGLGGQVVRRRTYDEEVAVDKLHFNDMMGSVREESDPKYSGTEGAGTVNGYVITADGEPLEMDQPSDENHIQFHGGFLEDANFHTNPGTAGVMGYFYRMGIRHYSPSLGRFLQRDPFSYTRAPHKSNPLSLNPYAYANNRPTQLSDRSGYQACPGCMDKSGDVPTQPATPPSGNGNTMENNGNNNGFNTPTSQSKKNPDCLVEVPRECIAEGDLDRYDTGECLPRCCTKTDRISWWEYCCSEGNVIPLENECKETSAGRCACACCWAGAGSGDINNPTTASFLSKQETFMKPVTIVPTHNYLSFNFYISSIASKMSYMGYFGKSNILIGISQFNILVFWLPLIGGLIGLSSFGLGYLKCLECKNIPASRDCCELRACACYLVCVNAKYKGILAAGGFIAGSVGVTAEVAEASWFGLAAAVYVYWPCLMAYDMAMARCHQIIGYPLDPMTGKYIEDKI
jgi:RHS repeat-associated protein